MGRKKSLTRIFSKLLWRELLHTWSQTLAIVAIGAIAITLFVGLQANAQSLDARVDEMVSLSSPADVYVTTDPHSLKADDDKDLILGCLGENDSLESRFYGFATLESRNAMLSVSPFYPRLSKGYDLHVTPEHSETDYFLLDEAFVSDLRAEDKSYDPLGKTLTFSFDLGSFQVDETTLSILDSLVRDGQKNPFREGKLFFSSTVTGTMKHPENTTKANPIPVLTMISNHRFKQAIVESLRTSFTEFGAALVYRVGFYEKLGWGDGNLDGGYATFPRPNQYLVQVADKSTVNAAKAKIVAAYKTKANNNLYTCQTLEETSFFSSLRTEVDQAQKLTMVFPVVFFVVAVLVILTTLRQNILKRRTEIGTFKALGVSTRQIHFHFQTQTAAMVLLASLIGAVLGPIILPEIMARKYNILYTLPAKHYLFPWAAGLASILAFIFVSLLVTFLITYKEIALKPVESMRPKAAKMRSKPGKASAKQQSRFALSAKMAKRSIINDPLKTIMVIVGLAGCTALLVCGFGIDNTIHYDVHTDPYVSSNFDVMPHYGTGQTSSRIETDMKSVKVDGNNAIASYAPYDRFSLEARHEDTTYTTWLFVLGEGKSLDGTPEEKHMVVSFSSMPKDTVLLSEKAADRLHAKVGDTLTFFVSGEYVNAKIHAIYDAFYGNGIVIRADSTLFTTPYDTFSHVWVRARNGVTQEKLKEALQSVSGIALVDTADAWLRRIESIVSSISTMTMAVKVFAILLAVVVIYNLGLLNFRERAREIATLKVLGFHTPETATGLLIETLSMTLVGIAIGLVAGFPFMKLVLEINEVEIIRFIYQIYPMTYVFASLFSMIIAIIVNVSFAYRIKKIKAVESLKSVE